MLQRRGFRVPRQGEPSSFSSHLVNDVGLGSDKNQVLRLPKTYGDLLANFTVQVKRDKKSGMPNRAVGCFALNKVPDGKYRIYYFRPKHRNRLIGAQNNSCSALDKI